MPGAGVTRAASPRSQTNVLLIGAGRMGSALLNGWRASGVKSIVVVEPKPSAEIRKLAKAKAIALVDVPSQVSGRFDACIVAIKPQILKGEAPALAAIAKTSLMISIAAGTSIAALRKSWGAKARIIRAMPNTPGAIGRGITGLYAAKGANAADKKKADTLLAALGQTVWVKSEALIDSVTALSGSGPAYVFHLVEAMTQAGIAIGLSKTEAEKLARATVAGAGALLDADTASAADLRIAVTSPGGTTEAALKVLMPELPGLMTRALKAAKKRAKELR
jgi:pyrroline-5-carboxylate reductase